MEEINVALDLNNFSNNQTEASNVIGDKTLRVGIIGVRAEFQAHILKPIWLSLMLK